MTRKSTPQLQSLKGCSNGWSIMHIFWSSLIYNTQKGTGPCQDENYSLIPCIDGNSVGEIGLMYSLVHTLGPYLCLAQQGMAIATRNMSLHLNLSSELHILKQRLGVKLLLALWASGRPFRCLKSVMYLWAHSLKLGITITTFVYPLSFGFAQVAALLGVKVAYHQMCICTVQLRFWLNPLRT